ncbi:sialate O-acetylesterase [Aquirhabdus sp.]|uniref:sialate O-acetylesterase n=1 Tax=Aquirhabdus sp. TaxID=2824160 RepID=UPI00396CCF66
MAASRKTPTYDLSPLISLYGEPTRVSISTDNVIYGIGVNGQSNAYGSSNGHLETQPAGYPEWLLAHDPILASKPIYPLSALMLDGVNPRQFGAILTKFIPLQESRTDIGGETLCASLVNHLLQKMSQATNCLPTFVAFVCAQGSARYIDLKRGSRWYADTLIAIQSAFDIAQSEGKPYIQLAMLWIQGESDNASTLNLSVNTRKAMLKQRERDMTADIKAITGQTQDIIFFEVQIAGSVNSRVEPDGAFNQNVKQTSVEMDGDGNNRLIGPFYQMPTSGNGLNQIHMDNKGQNELGQRCAQAILAECFGSGWRAFKPITDSLRWVSKKQFILEFDVPILPIVIDTSSTQVSTIGLGGGLGFWFDDYSDFSPRISSISVASDHSLQFNLSAVPLGKSVRLSYAMRATILPPKGYSGPYGPLCGPRGCIRDSTQDVNLYTGQKSYNWLNAFYMYFNYAY